jgi:hypothetical protein
MQQPPAAPRPGRPGTPFPRGTGPSRGAEDKNAGIMLETAIIRLVDVVDQETEALRDRKPIDLTVFNNRKSQGLLELDRALRLLDGADPGEPLKNALRTLRMKLETNQQVLNTHLEAVREVATIIANAIRSVESDGTYSFTFRSKGPEP